ncbi:PREDICTED: uncharacterized protein C6orf106 homolog, partial [Buceros rhinoceros silvestris]|uniref:uncharacterized protein C6orf106 homolog n=1 Tax=Buceros rhinoceros silvestris TaxID=175836 RepID=UPI000528ED4D
NLQAAIGAYYDFESPNINVPSMSFVEDVTIGEGESIPPDTQFTKTWRIQNTGTEAWPPGVCLKYVGGDQFGHVNMVMVRSLEPQEIADVSVQMCSPKLRFSSCPRLVILPNCLKENDLRIEVPLAIERPVKGALSLRGR